MSRRCYTCRDWVTCSLAMWPVIWSRSCWMPAMKIFDLWLLGQRSLWPISVLNASTRSIGPSLSHVTPAWNFELLLSPCCWSRIQRLLVWSVYIVSYKVKRIHIWSTIIAPPSLAYRRQHILAISICKCPFRSVSCDLWSLLYDMWCITFDRWILEFNY